MTSESKGTFRVERWDENEFAQQENGPHLRKAHVIKNYSGDIEGRGEVSYTFIYFDKNSAKIYGLERFVGRVDDKRGSFVFEHSGTFENNIADMVWRILPKSGTDELGQIEGLVEFKSGMQEEYPIVLSHHLCKEHHLFKKLLNKE